MQLREGWTQPISNREFWKGIILGCVLIGFIEVYVTATGHGPPLFGRPVIGVMLVAYWALGLYAIIKRGWRSFTIGQAIGFLGFNLMFGSRLLPVAVPIQKNIEGVGYILMVIYLADVLFDWRKRRRKTGVEAR
jgi:hypothetical protein